MPVEPAIGSQLGDYRLEELIGRGGMGVVYRAVDTVLDRPVALKLIAPELAGDERFRARFLRESRLAASIEHPNILPVHGAGEADGAFWIAMRYVDGEDLRALLQREEKLEPVRAMAILAPIADALDAAHTRGLVHRDVKPANILLDSGGRAYLSDFGLTKQLSSISGLTATGQVVGTLEYLAPEQIRGEQLDGRADQYALACVLYECVAGEPPFVRESEAQLLWAHMHEHAPSLRELGELDPVVHRGLAKKPDDRYSTCTQLLASARGALGVPAGAKPSRQTWLVAAGAAVLLAVAAVAVALALTSGGSGRPPLVVAPNSVARIDPRTNEIVDDVRVNRLPLAVEATNDAIWVTSQVDATLSRVDAKSREVVTVGGLVAPYGMTPYRGHDIWVGSFARGARVSLVDGDSLDILDQVAAPGDQTWFVAAGPGFLWVSNGSFTGTAYVTRVRLPSGDAQRIMLPEGSGPGHIAFGYGAAWIALGNLAQLGRIDARTSRVRRIDVGDKPSDPAVGFGAVWVAAYGDHRVWRVNAMTGRADAIVDVGRAPWNVATGAGSVWVTNEEDKTVSRIEPKTNTVVATIPTRWFPHGIAVGPDGVWVALAANRFPPS